MMELRDQDGTLLMSVGKTGGPAFPSDPGTTYGGMTLRQYAAIKLRVPDSGTDWLDDMIRTSLRNDFAAKAMQGIVAADSDPSPEKVGSIAEQAYILADAMLKARTA